MLKKIVLFLIVILIVVGGYFMLRPFIVDQKLNKTKLVSCRYSRGGDMMGSFESAAIRKNKDGSITYTTESAKAHNERIVTKTYQANEEQLQMFRDLAIRYHMYEASLKPMSPYIVYDGATSTLSFYFEDGTSFNVSDNQALSQKEQQHFDEIVRSFSSCAIGEPVVEIEKHEIALIIDGYQLGYQLEESEATEELITQLDEDFKMEVIQDYAQATTLKKPLPLTNLEQIEKATAGMLGYHAEKQQLYFFYNDQELNEKVYLLGDLTYANESSFDLLKAMRPDTYRLYLRK